MWADWLKIVLGFYSNELSSSHKINFSQAYYKDTRGLDEWALLILILSSLTYVQKNKLKLDKLG